MTERQPPAAPVSVRLVPPIAHIALQDETNGNRITPAARTALPAALRQAVADPGVRAILLTGLPEVFCAGGTREDLAAAGQGQARTPAGWDFVRAPADCPLPVVAAVQGHAIGGGLLLALNADVVVLSERSSYAANFLTYGFTPCLGATHLLPRSMGPVLGTEMIYTGRPYRGRELAARGAGVTITTHDQVVPRALAMAQRIAQAPRMTLELLKAHLSAPVGEEALAAFRSELANHTATLASAEAQLRITALYPDSRHRAASGSTTRKGEP